MERSQLPVSFSISLLDIHWRHYWTWTFHDEHDLNLFHFIALVHSSGIWSFPITNSQSDDSVYKLAVSFYHRNIFMKVLLCVRIFLSLSLHSIVLPFKLLSRSRCSFRHANCFIFSVLLLMFLIFLSNVAQGKTFCSANLLFNIRNVLLSVLFIIS